MMTDLKKIPPVAARHSRSEIRHGVTLIDEYAWLKDENWQAVMRDPSSLKPQIRSYLEAENAHTEDWFEPVRDLKDRLFSEMKGRLKQDDSSVPRSDGPFSYFRKFVDGGQHPHYCRQPVGGGAAEVLLDGDEMASDLAYFKIGAIEHSPDHKTLAYSIDSNGSEIFTIRFRDLESGAVLDDLIEGAHGGFEWAADSRSLFYTVLDDNHRPYAIRCHQSAGGPDQEIYLESDPGFFVDLDRTDDRKFLVVHVHDHQTSEVYLIDTNDPATLPQLVQKRQPKLEYEVSHRNGQLLILTNADGAEDFKIVTAPVSSPGRENWQDLVPHRAGCLILGLQVFAEFWVRVERSDGLPRLVVSEFATGQRHEISFDEETYSLGLSGGYEFHTDIMRFTYSSMATPEQVYDYNMRTRTRVLRKQQEIPSGHEPANYVTRRLMAPAADGEHIPISVLYRKDIPLDGSAPALLYGYGSYGHAIPASFSTARLSLVDRGFVYAIAHIRGGMEKGYGWYTAGKRECKKNTFSDFIAAGEFLAAQRFTSAGRIAAHGGSAGGMLVGAVINMRPEMFGAAVAEVPFVDVLNTMCDASLPLTPPEWPEWGNPIDDRDAFAYIRSYSPYEQVSAKDYPPLFVTAGLTDPRVTYWEPAKWVARLRALKTDRQPLLLRTNMDAGHGGAAGRFDRLQESALAYAFVLTVLGRS